MILIETYTGKYLCNEKDIIIGGELSIKGISIDADKLLFVQMVQIDRDTMGARSTFMNEHQFKIEKVFFPNTSIFNVSYLTDESVLVQEYNKRKSGLITNVDKQTQNIILGGK